jgi:hypothetical protein
MSLDKPRDTKTHRRVIFTRVSLYEVLFPERGKLLAKTAHPESGLRSRSIAKQGQIVLTLLFLFVLLSFLGFAYSVSAQTTGIGLVRANAIQGSGVGSVSVTFPTGNTVGCDGVLHFRT